METEIIESPSLFLTFEDRRLEDEFRFLYEQSTRESLRAGLLFSLLAWSMGIGLAYLTIPQHFVWVSFVIVIAVFPYFLFIIYTTYHGRYTGFYQIMAASTNTEAGILTIYVFSFLQGGEYYSLALLTLIIFFGGYIYQLRYIYYSIASLIYVAAFQIYILLIADLPFSDVLLFSFIIWLAEIFAIWMGYRSERTDRILFVQRKKIIEQKAIIEKEQEKSEKLLLNILPVSIAQRLKEHESTIADSFDFVTVLFADLVGFTAISKKLSPEELVTLLNDIFSRFDQLIENHGLEKIKTIGDAYMIAGGLPEPQKDHAEAIADVALEMRRELSKFNEKNQHAFDIRMGIHTGSVVAGVIGVKKFVYDVWGDTVNTANRMESHGIPGQIQVSETTYELLKEEYVFQERGFIEVKGKGKMKTYLLQEKKGKVHNSG